MNWYQHLSLSLGSDLTHMSRCFAFVKSSAAKPSIIKLAYSSREHQTDIARQNDSDNATCKVKLVESKNKFTVSVTYTTDVYAFPLYEETWLYAKGESKRAVKTFNRIINVIEDVKIEAEEDELPTPSVQGIVREELRYVDVDRKKPAISASLLASRNEPGQADWRQSLYGNRYPSPTVIINNENGTITLNNG